MLCSAMSVMSFIIILFILFCITLCYNITYIILQDVTLDGYRIPKGHYVAYISRFANRDDKVFEKPDNFLPERWRGM